MRKMLLSLAMVLVLTVMASASWAGDGRHWTIVPDASWTVADKIVVQHWFMENGQPVPGTSDTLTSFGTPETVATNLPVDGLQFMVTDPNAANRTVCLRALSFREEAPSLVSAIQESCFTFLAPPKPAPAPPTLLSP